MINAAGFKVWPAEVEAMFYKHPDVQEACVIATRDAYRGESPRVGDGVILLDFAGRCAYTSPNAVSALHRIGFHANALGRRSADGG